MYPEKPSNMALKVTSGIVVIIAVVLVTIASAVSANEKKQQTATTANQTTSASIGATTSTTTTPSTSASSTTYKDGTYTASNQYYVPHGYEDIKVTLTVKSGVVADSTVVNSENDRESQIFQEDFASAYKSYVVGKNIDGLNLSSVAGASDTTNGFNSAVNDIQNQAKA
ncbi:MAG: hypothetical protein JWO99_804 [Candidatus Saccharibacteria bacterium]|nr:hypothetical protein [Candidatus Saccharibacteria bacterium]